MYLLFTILIFAFRSVAALFAVFVLDDLRHVSQGAKRPVL